jgi:hypothetical protein
LGTYDFDSQKFEKVGEEAYFWSTEAYSSTVEDKDIEYVRSLFLSTSALVSGLGKEATANVRCIKK